MEKTHWKKLDNPDYLGAYAFQPGEKKVLEIVSVGTDMVYSPTGNKKEECTVVRFKNQGVQPLILNKVNAKMISKIHGSSYIEDWAGKLITLYVKKEKVFGSIEDVVRVESRVPTLERFICGDCGKDVCGAGGKSAKEVAGIGEQEYGRILCIACMKAEKKKMDSRVEE